MSALAATAALFTRDIRGVVRARSQLYSSMFTPLLLLVFLGTGVSRGLQPSRLPAGSFTAYLVAGAVVMTTVFSSTFSSASYYRDRDSGLLRMLLSSPHRPQWLLLGKSLAGVAIGAIQGMAVLLIAWPFVDFEWQYGVIAGLALSLAAITLLNLFLGGVAQLLASRIQTMQGFHLVIVECSVRRAMHGLFGLLDFVNGIPATYGRVTDAKVAMGASLGGLKSKNWSRS